MTGSEIGRLIILSGPSCAGKSPLAHAFARLYPEQNQRLLPLVVYTSRPPRPAEKDGIDYHFRSREEVERLGAHQRFVVMQVRNDLQGLDVGELKDNLQRSDVFYEGNPFFGVELIRDHRLVDIPRLSIFMTPISRAEVLVCREEEGDATFARRVVELMKNKQVRRAEKIWGRIGDDMLADIEARANSSYHELKKASLFDFVIVNHDGEDSDHWDLFARPIGDAGRSVRIFVSLLRGEVPEGVEKWEPDLLP